MLPTLVYELQAIAIRVEDIGRIVARIVVESNARCTIIRGSGRNGGGMGGIHFTLAGVGIDLPVSDSENKTRIDESWISESQVAATSRKRRLARKSPGHSDFGFLVIPNSASSRNVDGCDAIRGQG